MKSLLKVAFASIFVLAMAGLMVAQTTTTTTSSSTLPNFNPPPCDFNNTFYADNGIDSSSGSELNAEPDGRFGTFRQTGPPATGSQVNWVTDSTCSTNDPTRRNVRILATTGGNSDDGNSPFSCFDGAPNPGVTGPNQFGPFAVFPQCTQQPTANPRGQRPETAEFISILAFLHNQAVFESSYTRTVGFINGGLDGVQQNPGIDISLVPGTDNGGNSTGVNPRHDDNNPPLSGISMQFIVGNFEAYASIDQFGQTLQCPAGATVASQCSPAPGHFANAPCSLGMINNLQSSFNNGQPGENNGNPVTTLPTFCFNVADTQSNGHTISDVATPKLRQNWRFATNRNAMDGSDGNCIQNDPNVCGDGVNVSTNDAPFGYFCDDLLGMWIITYFWFTAPVNDTACGGFYNSVGQANGFTPDGFPIILTAHELNDILEGNQCGAEGQEDPGGSDNGAAWLVCPALPDPRNGAITSDAFLDAAKNPVQNSFIDNYIFNTFVCLQKKGKFCDESSSISQ